jgi:hypothetical protein
MNLHGIRLSQAADVIANDMKYDSGRSSNRGGAIFSPRTHLIVSVWRPSEAEDVHHADRRDPIENRENSASRPTASTAAAFVNAEGDLQAIV